MVVLGRGGSTVVVVACARVGGVRVEVDTMASFAGFGDEVEVGEEEEEEVIEEVPRAEGLTGLRFVKLEVVVVAFPGCCCAALVDMVCY